MRRTASPFGTHHAALPEELIVAASPREFAFPQKQAVHPAVHGRDRHAQVCRHCFGLAPSPAVKFNPNRDCFAQSLSENPGVRPCRPRPAAADSLFSGSLGRVAPSCGWSSTQPCTFFRQALSRNHAIKRGARASRVPSLPSRQGLPADARVFTKRLFAFGATKRLGETPRKAGGRVRPPIQLHRSGSGNRHDRRKLQIPHV